MNNYNENENYKKNLTKNASRCHRQSVGLYKPCPLLEWNGRVNVITTSP